MGIKQLFSIIKENAPEAIKEGEIKNHFGRKVAIVSTCPVIQPSTMLTMPPPKDA
jgi:flap endonuclease-1